MAYTKIIHNNIAYYIREEHVAEATSNIGLLDRQLSSFRLMSCSVFVINIKTNELLKCRERLLDVIDFYLKDVN
jgi:hypothetical protein